ncbi:MAG: Beta-lactamase domain protein [Microgenomates group bacterium GW2011_GWC1_37_8]|uniref:Beta-lactamase domain protein n=1 Tax=Candidatus Woesebacteria bacterium GW2011_GWB1_38_8 TaxID=1618570 RepID=A0A0G0NJG1_9BACT|nr:MAG: Beta-lactamase domain protein [Microgenomates group bacterium GW2011_GWC1_37_8]KKQ86054.1 MAG: Beta-lactamase domain protein [Candidatus Woesebacteria bacterium GW2011_GWB1_38_8]
MSLKFIALSGTVGVTENLYVYEADGKMMIIDCGVGFPDLEMPGVDLVIPDFSYVVKNKEKLVGIVISQGHEDHIGALPYLLREVNAPIWSTPLVTEFIKDKFIDYGVKNFTINTFNPEYEDFEVGPFRVFPFRVTHSVPDTVGFAIDTPEGRIFHVPEHKMDQNPVDGKPFDIERAKGLANDEKHVLFLASDCLGSNKLGFTEGETQIEGNMEGIMKKAENAILATAISSNIGRFQQMMNVAQWLNRKVVLVGRSIQKKIEIAYKLGYISFPANLVVSFGDAARMKRSELMYIVAGCYGQVGSSLYRISLGEHDRVHVNDGDMMVFSADPAPPYTKESEDFVIDNLIDKGVDVHYYDLNEGLDEGIYASGHGGQGDIVELFKIVNPKYFIPIGGTIRFMHSYKKLVVKNGNPPSSVLTLKPGENVIFENGQARLGDKIPVKAVLVHGLGVGDVGKVVLGDRAILGNEGVVVVVFKIRQGKIIDLPEIISRGFIFEKISKDLLDEAAKRLKNQIEKKVNIKKSVIYGVTMDYLGKFFFQKTGRRPMILPVVVEV